MMTGVMQWFCRQSGKKKFTQADIQGMKDTAKLKAGDRNPYSWNIPLHPVVLIVIMDTRKRENKGGTDNGTSS